MSVGNLLALRQESAKRLLAYSSIAQAGYLLVGVAAIGSDELALPGFLVYLAVYVFMNLGAFLAVERHRAPRRLRRARWPLDTRADIIIANRIRCSGDMSSGRVKEWGRICARKSSLGLPNRRPSDPWRGQRPSTGRYPLLRRMLRASSDRRNLTNASAAGEKPLVRNTTPSVLVNR